MTDFLISESHSNKKVEVKLRRSAKTKINKLNALINLLDDPDQLVFEMVYEELLKESSSIIPMLELRWEQSSSEIGQERIENLIQDLLFKNTKKDLKKWLSSRDGDLLKGLMIIDKIQYVDFNEVLIRQKVDKIKNAVWLELNSSLTILEKITILNHFLFNEYGFSINKNFPKSPQNFFLSQLLETKKGDPISLTILYTVLLRGLGIPAQLTGTSSTPLVGIIDHQLAEKIYGKESGSSVLFYVNPSNNGSIAGQKEIFHYLKGDSYTDDEKFAEPKPDSLFLYHLLKKMQDAFNGAGLTGKEKRTKELITLFKAVRKLSQ